jgi:GAF domain-containing protein
VLPYDAADVTLIKGDIGRIVRHRGYIERGLGEIINQIQFNLAEDPSLTQMMTTGKPIIKDVRQSPLWRTVENSELEWMASYIGAPIFLHGRVAGFLNLNSQQPNHYQPKYLFLLEAFASQVSAAITNADLHDIVAQHSSELEGRIRDMVLVYEIGKALTSTLNLYKIYTLFYEDFIRTLFASAELQVFLIDQGDSEGYVCDFAIADGKELNTDEISLTLDEVALLSQAIIDDDHVQFNGVFYQPLITRGDPIGVLKIIPGPDDNPAGVDITLLTIVASVAATAIDNARLYTTVNEQHREITALYRATRVLYKTDNVSDLAWLITSSIVAEFNYLDCGIILHNEDTGKLDRVVRTGAYTLEVTGSFSSDGKGLVPLAARTGHVAYAPDVREELNYLPSDPRTRSELVVPLVTFSGIIGVMDLQSTKVDAFTEQDQRVLVAFAERAAAAIENLQLMEKTRNHVAELEHRLVERTEELRLALKKHGKSDD